MFPHPFLVGGSAKKKNGGPKGLGIGTVTARTVRRKSSDHVLTRRMGGKVGRIGGKVDKQREIQGANKSKFHRHINYRSRTRKESRARGGG